MKKLIFITTIASFSIYASVQANSQPAINKANNLNLVQECTAEKIAIKRLACFDEIFNTPIFQELNTTSNTVSNTKTTANKRVKFLNTHVDSLGDQLKESLSLKAYEGSPERMILSVIAQESIGISVQNKPILFFQCHQDTTSMQILWPESLDTGSIDIQFYSKNKLLLDKVWRVIDEEYLIHSPMGLPGIDSIKTLFNQEMIKVIIQAAKGKYETHFNISDLREHIKPLGKTCHWL